MGFTGRHFEWNVHVSWSEDGGPWDFIMSWSPILIEYFGLPIELNLTAGCFTKMPGTEEKRGLLFSYIRVQSLS